MKHLRELLQSLSARRRLHDLSLEEEDLLNAVIERSRREQLRLCTLLALAAGSLIFLISLALFLIHDVVLYRNDIAVSRTGALMPRKACQCEQALYLFNTSQLWADTGITLREGDRVKISVSGAFHSSLPQLVRSARENNRPPYAWLDATWGEQRFVDSDTLRKGETLRPETGPEGSTGECIVPDARFGAILCQVVPDAEPCLSDHTAPGFNGRIHVLTPEDGNRFRRITRSGTLYLAVNDIYLNDSIIACHEHRNRLAARTFFEKRSMLRDGDTARIEHFLEGNALLIDEFLSESGIELYCRRSRDSLLFAGPSFVDYFSRNRDVWFNDNLGQIAVSIDIRRRIDFYSHALWYRSLETQLTAAIDERHDVSVWRTAGRWMLLLAEFFIVVPLLFFSLSALATLTIYAVSALLLWICRRFIALPLGILRRFDRSRDTEQQHGRNANE